MFRGLARNSAVAVIADRTAYDVRYTDILSNGIKRRRLEVDERLIGYAQSDSTCRVYESTQAQSTQA